MPWWAGTVVVGHCGGRQAAASLLLAISLAGARVPWLRGRPGCTPPGVWYVHPPSDVGRLEIFSSTAFIFTSYTLCRTLALGPSGVDSGRGQNRTLRLLLAFWPPVFAGEQNVGPSNGRDVGQQIGLADEPRAFSAV